MPLVSALVIMLQMGLYVVFISAIAWILLWLLENIIPFVATLFMSWIDILYCLAEQIGESTLEFFNNETDHVRKGDWGEDRF